MGKAENKALQRQLLMELARLIPNLGFGPRLVGQSFYRNFPDGRSVFHVSFIEHDEDFDVTVDVAVRFDAVEDLVNRTNDLLSGTEKKQTATLGAELGNIVDGEPRRWTVRSTDDVPLVATQIVDALASIGIPYLEQFEDPGRAFIALSSNDKPAWHNSPIHGSRCMRALALAIVLGRTDDIPVVVRDCESFLRDRKDPALPAFQRFVSSVQAA